MLSAPRNVHLGPGTNLYDFTFAPNLALAQILAAKNLLEISPAGASNSLSAAGKPFFITNSEPMQFRDFLKMVWGSFDKFGSHQQKQVKGLTIPTHVALVVVWICQKAAKMVGAKPFLTVQDLGDSLAQRWFDNSSAQRVLGYVPRVTLAQALSEAAAGYRVVNTIMSD
jgi:sterol-4alpha-carboxylate 3-dehydrogenase (decarboxylating)